MSFWRRADLRAGARVGLALALAYGIALSMDWQKPQWAGISVVVLSVAPVAAAMEKAWLRVLGSLAGAMVAFALVAWFPQERWWFLISLSLWVGLCAFFMRRSPHPYSWNVAGFVCPIIAIGAGPPYGVLFFSTAVERLQETMAGILSFTLCAVLIGEPRSPQPAVERWNDCRAALLALAGHLDDTLRGSGSGPERQAELQRGALATISTLEAKSMPISATPAELRRLVEALHHLWLSLLRAPRSVRDPLKQPWQRLHATLRALLGEPGGGISTPEPEPGTPTGDGVQRQELNLRDRSLLRISDTLLTELERCIQAIANPTEIRDLSTHHHAFSANHVLEDDVIAALQVSVAMLCGSLLWIFLPDLPTGASLLTHLAPLAMAFCNSFGSPAYMVLSLVGQGIAIGVVLQVFVLTRMSNYASLALLLFAIGMGITVWYYRNGLARFLMPIVVISILAIRNVQTFSFPAVLYTSLMLLIIAAIVTVVGEFPFSSNPEAVFQRLHLRFARLTFRMTAGRPMAWGYGSALAAPSELRALLGALQPHRLPAPLDHLKALVSDADACRFWLATWWSWRQRCAGMGVVDEISTDVPIHRELEGPEQHLSAAMDQLQRSISGCERYLSQAAADPSPTGATAVETYLGACLQLRWSLRHLASQSRAVDWQHWPHPPLPWSPG